MAENEIETSHDHISATLYDHASATRLAKRFLHLILLLYAVPQPEELSVFEKGHADFGWRLGLCKTYQDNTAFMAVVRDLSVLLLFVAERHEDPYSEDQGLEVPPEVLSVCQQYAKLARDNLAAARAAVKADVFQRGVLHAIRKNDHVLKEDEVGLITDKTRRNAKAAMVSLLCQLRNLR